METDANVSDYVRMLTKKKANLQPKDFVKKVRRFVVTEFVKTCDELVIGIQLISRKS